MRKIIIPARSVYCRTFGFFGGIFLKIKKMTEVTGFSDVTFFPQRGLLNRLGGSHLEWRLKQHQYRV